MSPARKPVDTSTYSGRFAARLRELREKAGLSVEQVVEALGIPQRTFYGWENASRQPSFDVLPKLADSLGVSVRTLMPKE